MKKRMGLFVFFDRDNIVDDYVLYMLDEISKELDGMVIISNSNLSKKEKQKFDKYCFKYLQRENKGLDAGALCEYFRNNDDYKDYDEIVYFNDTFFAPLYPFKEVFDEMDKRDCDFWGLATGEKEQNSYNSIKELYYPKHIQTFFMVFRSDVFNSDAFHKYWEKYDYDNMNTFIDVVSKHELIFTKYLVDNGFKYDYYIKSKLVSEDYHKNFNHFAFSAANQIIDEKAIFIKRKNFSFPSEFMLYMKADSDLKKSYEYIQNHTNYDTRLIWKNILRLYNIYDIAQVFGLNEIVTPKKHTQYTKVSYFIIIDNEYIVDMLINKMKKVNGDFKFYTSVDSIYKRMKNLKYDIYKYQDDLMNIVIKDMKKTNNDYIGFFNLTDEENTPIITYYSKAEAYLDNLLQDKDYVEEVINKINDKNISMAYAPNTFVKDDFRDGIIWDPEIFNIVNNMVPNYKLFNISKNPVSQQEAWIAKKELLKNIPSHVEKIDNKLFARAFSTAMCYYGAQDYKYPIIVSNLEFSNYYISLQNSIINSSFTTLYNTKSNKDYPPSVIFALNDLKKLSEPINGKKIVVNGVKRRLIGVKRFFGKIIRKIFGFIKKVFKTIFRIK